MQRLDRRPSNDNLLGLWLELEEVVVALVIVIAAVILAEGLLR